MNENENFKQIAYEEIGFRDLVLALWRQKIIIISIIVITTIIAGIYSLFILSPTYHSKLNIVINMPETYKTKYGEYTLPITSNQQYINLITSNSILINTILDMGYDAEGITIEQLKSRISIDAFIPTIGTEQNNFGINVAAGSPTDALKLAETLYDNYIKFVKTMITQGTADEFFNKLNVELLSQKILLEANQEILMKNEDLLANTPEIINQKDAMQELQDSENTSDYIILENIINPNYTLIENNIISIKQAIFGIENSISIINGQLEELGSMKKILDNYYVTGEFDSIESTLSSVTDTSIVLPSAPVAPNQKTGPSNTKNIIIGIILGGMIGVATALIKEFWFKKENQL
ncbi:MAG: Wzz/FepE/Etk N-terminal domain-containing protein [Mobilitalea sp.]